MMTMRSRGLAALVFSLFVAMPASAVDEKDLLPVDTAFALKVSAPSRDRIELSWKIADGYYLYRHRTSVQTDAAFKAQPLQMPRGDRHTDEFFGEVETYRTQLVAALPGVAAQNARQVALKVKYQGCADVGVCYPPQTRTLTVALPAVGAAVVGAASAASSSTDVQEKDQELAAEAAPTKSDSGFAALGKSLGSATQGGLLGTAPNGASEPLPLPPEQAFKFEAIADGGNALLLRFTPAKGYYLYRDKTSLKLDADGIALERPRWPKGQLHRDEHFGDVTVYFDQIDLPVPLRRSLAEAQKVTLTANFQGCQDDGICYPPMTRSVSLNLPAGEIAAAPAVVGAASAASFSQTAQNQDQEIAAEAAPTRMVAEGPEKLAAEAAPTKSATAASGALAEDSRLAAALSGSHRWLTLLGFFGAGLLLAFTPCVLPMIPILSGLIAGRGERIGARRAFTLSLVYVLASAVVFTLVGVIAGLLGANLQIAFQKPWVIVLFAALFVALALSMFGLYELQLPAALRQRIGAITDKQRGGSWAGVAAMGALSALIVGPCVAPPLAGAVAYIAQTRDPVFGGAALFLLAMGMGAPLLAFGVAAGRGLPTSGPWMTAVQRVFGFVFVGLAIWMLSRILPGAATLALFGVLALAAAAWAFSLAKSGSGERTRWIARFAGLLLAVIGAAELLGAMAGGKDPLQPLAGAFGGRHETRELEFRMIKSSADLDREIAAARDAGKPLLFDFYADWCVACKEMEKYTFTEPAVHEALADFVLLKADVTANDDIDQALMKRFGIIGPPATLFFVDGAERRELRLVGFEKADAFVQRSGHAKP
ncbi:protein-disulfide reductase DsbD [Luteimonas sp. SX5]|uniref:Thiol:disulfide interchange protein DsbD n=1 Tax=Luteimonas galliterrae TaxID=2940486 RepID=A0ABT0MLM1_9GAMM|nr:protein-disulfide reductase DsbD [Luteimonas galliterrae]MCL1635558.1 protein-disulfide reductase DsbD [Luteimonas galliterrae]